MAISLGLQEAKFALGNYEISKISLGDELIYSAGSTVTYYVDEGVQPIIEEVDSGDSCLSPTTFTPSKSGWNFVGWSEDESMTIVDELIMDSDPFTLYAVFNQDVTLSYNGNGSTSGSTSSETKKTYYNNGIYEYPIFTLKDCGFTKTNYSFNGWDLGQAGDEVEITKDTTAKAQWVGVPYTWVNNYVQSGATLSITIETASNTNTRYKAGTNLNTFKLEPDRKDNTDMMSIKFKTNAVDTRGLKYMTIVFEDFYSSRQNENEDYFEVRSSSGTSLFKSYARQYGTTVKVDVSKASSVYIYGRIGAWGYDALPECQVKSISFGN